jgi:predicted ArsR family transcriptional regulator
MEQVRANRCSVAWDAIGGQGRTELSVAECAREMGCCTKTALRRLRRLEHESGVCVLGSKVSQGRKKFVVQRSDLDRAARAAGIAREDPGLTAIYESLEALECGQRRTHQMLTVIARHMGLVDS